MKLLIAIALLTFTSFGTSKKFPKDVKEIKIKGTDGSDQAAKYMPSTSSKNASLKMAMK